MTARPHTRTALALAAAMLAFPAAAQASLVQGSGAAPSGSVNSIARTGEDARLAPSHSLVLGRNGEDARLVSSPNPVQVARDFPGDYRPATIPAPAFTTPSVTPATDKGFGWSGALILALVAGAMVLALIGANKFLTGSMRRTVQSP